MFPNSFDYQKPTSVEEAIQLISNHPESKLLAGGQSLLSSMKLRLSSPSHLVDISKLPALKGISEANGNLVIGAGVTHAEIEHSALVKKHAASLAECAGVIGDMMIRNRGTIGGSIAHADPAADYPGVLVSLQASMQIVGKNGSRTVSASDFFTGFFETALKEGELVHQVIIPSHQGWKTGYVKYPNPSSRYPIVGCAVAIKGSGNCEDVRIGFSGVSFHAFRDSSVENALKGRSLNADTIQNASNQAAEGVEVLEDNFSSAEYRKQMAKHFIKIAISKLI